MKKCIKVDDYVISVKVTCELIPKKGHRIQRRFNDGPRKKRPICKFINGKNTKCIIDN